VLDSQLTTYAVLNELNGRGIRWLTLRQRGQAELARLADLPASQWKTVTISRSGRYRRQRLHEDLIKLKGVDARVRQIAVRNIGRDEPTHLRVPPGRTHLRRPAQCRPGHHPDRHRRQPLSAPGQKASAVWHRHP
jgi:hypothetical protein